MERLTTGAAVPDMRLDTVNGGPVVVPDPDRLVHVQFRRFAGCPICNLHLRSFVRRAPEIEAAGVCEVVFFHSSADELRQHTADLPFAVIADPTKQWYRRFGVECGRRALLDPRVWAPLMWGVLRDTLAIVRGRRRLPSLQQPNGRLGLPADFLIGRGGRVAALKYGEHASDHWSVDELLALAAEQSTVDA